MIATHTPGPWKYDGSSDPLPHDYACSTERIAAGGVTIAEVATCEDDTCPGVGEGWANARLIAAAPELLAALASMLGVAEMDCMDVKSNEWRSRMVDAGAALAKAKNRGDR